MKGLDPARLGVQMTLFRRLRDVPLRLPLPGSLELPDQAAAHKCPGDVWRATDSALRRVADVELAPSVVRWVGALAVRLAPYVEKTEVRTSFATRAELEVVARRLRKPFYVCARLGTAFAQVETELRPIEPDRSDAVIATALGFSSFLQTRFGPVHLGYYMWRTTRVSYYLARVGDRVDPSDLLPTVADISIVFNEVTPSYSSATEAMQLAWDTLVEPSHPNRPTRRPPNQSSKTSSL